MNDAICSELPHTVVGPPPEYYPLKCSTSSEILTPLLWRFLRDVLPKRILTYCVKRLYASYEDGYGLIPLLRSILVFSLTHRKAGTEAPTLLLFQMEANRDILIVYRDDCWQNRNDGKGSKNTLLMRFSNHHLCVWRADSESACESWVYIRSTDDRLMVGAGGKEGVSLVVMGDLYHGSSQRSDVFRNEPLQQTELFSIRNAELYSFVL